MKKVKKSEKYGYETKLVVKRAAKMAENVFHGYFRVPPKEKKTNQTHQFSEHRVRVRYQKELGSASEPKLA